MPALNNDTGRPERMKDQTNEEPSDPVPGSLPDDAKWPGCGSTQHGGKHGKVQDETETWMEQVLDPTNMHSAWLRVRRNGGAPGMDGMTIAQFPAFARQHWERIRAQLSEGSYHPAPVRRVFIPKPDGSQRPLGVPTVLDRVIQQAVAQVLTPLYDGEFSDQSYGFREGRSAHQAVRRVQTAWKQRLRHAIDCDLKAFFDTVNHDRLLNQLRPKIGSGRLLRLIGRYLRAGVVMPDGTREVTPLGVPQGSPLSPLLANITLDPLDKEIERRGHGHARYADDFIILVAGEKKAQRVMESVTRFIERKLKLVVNRTKSKSGPLIESSFLGFCISSRGSIKWTAKAYERFKQRIKDITRRNRGHAIKAVIDELRRYATGWMNYFGISKTYREVLELDDWIRRRVRLYHWKQWKRPRTRRRNLIKLGANPDEVHMASRSRKGYWRMSRNSIVQQALSNRRLKEQGVPELRSIWIKLHHGEAVKPIR
jgi:RNA-directed DNA polymerase